MVKNTLLDKKINLLLCLQAELHHEDVLEPVVDVVVGVPVHLSVLKLFLINLLW